MGLFSNLVVLDSTGWNFCLPCLVLLDLVSTLNHLECFTWWNLVHELTLLTSKVRRFAVGMLSACKCISLQMYQLANVSVYKCINLRMYQLESVTECRLYLVRLLFTGTFLHMKSICLGPNSEVNDIQNKKIILPIR